MQRLLIIDNYDSFTYNLAQIVETLPDISCRVMKSDLVSLEIADEFDKILFSPGPGLPTDFPIMKMIVQTFGHTKSILGICLGHQAIVEAFGGKLVNMPEVCHGMRETITVTDTSDYLFGHIPAQFTGGLYHSWMVNSHSLPDCLTVTAMSDKNIIMAISHKGYDVKGIQFHPESYMTEYGTQILKNWIQNR